jgi:hypothetical protein
VAQTIVLAGYYNNPRRSFRSKDLDLPFYKLLSSYKTQDPIPKPQLVLPVHAVQCAAAFYKNKTTLLARAIADLLTTIAFFFLFLLCPGEYTMPTTKTKTCTVQFHRKDVQIFKAGNILPTRPPWRPFGGGTQSDSSWTTRKVANVGQRCITPPYWSHFAQSKRWPTQYTIYFRSCPPIPSLPSVLSALALTSSRIISRWQCAKMLSCLVSSTPATACPELVPTHSKPVELWPYNSTMLMKTSSKKWVDGQAPGGSRIYTLKFLPSPQVCPNAWWCTMCFITLGRNPMSLYPSFYRFPWQGEGATQIHHRRAMLVCLLHQLRCTKLYNNRPVY